jgi:muramidase (phage lysozyme)
MMNTALPNTNNRRFSGFSTHPWATVPDGLRPKSTAAGAYQILYGTWKEILDKGLIELSEGAASFTPDIQDRIAVMKLEDRSALHLIRSGKLDEAITQTDLKDEWSSLPGGRHNAGRRTAEGKPLDLTCLKSLFNTYLAEEKRKFGL